MNGLPSTDRLDRLEETMQNRTAHAAVILTITWGALCPTLAQSDPQTEDWSRQDQKYMERMEQRNAEEKHEKKDPEEIRLEYIENAKKLIRDKNYTVKKTARYLIRTDDPRLDLVAAGILLERFREFFEQFWEGEVELAPFEEKSQVFLFYSFYKYNKILTGKARFGEFRPAGHYRADLDLITLHSDSSPLDDLPGALVHEAAHQLVQKMLFEPGPRRPDWLDEGLANYFGFNGLKEMGEGSRSVAKSGKKPNPNGPREMLSQLKDALGDRESPFSVIELLDMEEPREFYGDRIRVHYAASWALVHYLLHGEEGRFREPFVRFMHEDPAMAGGAKKLLEMLGVDEAAFMSAYERHARKMKP